jgi:hypothetical protein
MTMAETAQTTRRAVAFVYKNAGPCSDCGSELPPQATGRPRQFCDRCRRRQRVRSYLEAAQRQARLAGDDEVSREIAAVLTAYHPSALAT